MAITTTNYALDYANRAALLADGWDYIAKETDGDPRDTEVPSATLFAPLRTPVTVDDPFVGTPGMNMLFRNLPAAWSSVRVQSTFDPSYVNFARAGVALYADDANYVWLNKRWNYVPNVVQELAGTAAVMGSDGSVLPATAWLRIDRAKDEETYTFYTSTDGTAWTQVHSGGIDITGGIRLALFASGLESGSASCTWSHLDLDVGWSDALDTPSVSVSSTTDPSTVGGANGSITITWAAVDGADHYVAEIADGHNATAGFDVDDSDATSPHVFTGLTAGQYTVAVTAYPAG